MALFSDCGCGKTPEGDPNGAAPAGQLVTVKYLGPNRSPLYGPKSQFSYGVRTTGEVFDVYLTDVQYAPHIFMQVANV